MRLNLGRITRIAEECTNFNGIGLGCAALPRSYDVRMPEQHDHRTTIALSMGDPGGIGPEVIVKALADPSIRRQAHVRIFGDEDSLAYAADRAGVSAFWWSVDPDPARIASSLDQDVVLVRGSSASGTWSRHPSKRSGEASFQYVERAIQDARRPAGDPLRADAIVTGPISKRRGRWPGVGSIPGTPSCWGPGSGFGGMR